MSSILKAIRKVEEEKRVTSHAAPDLRSDQGATIHVKKSLGPLLIGMMLGAVCVGLFLYASYEQENVVKAQPKPAEEKSVTRPPEPAPAKPVVETIPVVTLPPEPVGVSATATPVKKTVPVASPEKVTAPSIPEQPKRSTLPANIKLVVAEIFYQADPANSMAVVNDLPVMSGTTVGGAIVQEIHPDHVVFRVEGKDFTVLPAN